MKFIREMIARKNRSPELDALPDGGDFELDDGTEDDFGAVTPVSTQSIQARLQSALERADIKYARNAESDNGRTPVEDFRDIVGKRTRAQPRAAEQRSTASDPGPDDEVDLGELSDLAQAETSDADDSPLKLAVGSPDRQQTRGSNSMDAHEMSSPDLRSGDGQAALSDQASPDTSSESETPEAVTPINLRVATSSDSESPRILSQTQPNREFAVIEPENDVPDPVEADASTTLDRVAKSVLSEVSKMPPPVTQMVEVPAPAAGRSGRRAGRVKTRLLGFEHAHGSASDPFDAARGNAGTMQGEFPVGWIVVIKGLGRGSSFMLSNGVSQIGRGEDQAIRLDFGDSSISRNNHAAIAYDREQRAFFIGHGGKSNLVRLNNKPVLSTEELADGDLIRIGETVLRFVGLCGPDFDWETNEEDVGDAAIA